MKPEDTFRKQREAMVYRQIEERGIRDPRLLDVMRRLPRHWFVPPALRGQAYADKPLPIGWNATISQPYIVAAMTELLNLSGDETVLEIGTGSGYQAAVLAEMARWVHTVEYQPELAQQAAQTLSGMQIANVAVHVGDGTLGWPQEAPYQAILVTAAAPALPNPLIEQLAEGGRLVIPVGGLHDQELERWRKSGGQVYREKIFPVEFVPLIGHFGWQKEDWEE